MNAHNIINNIREILTKLESKLVLEKRTAQVKEALTDVGVAQLLTLKGDKLISYPITTMTEQQQLNMYAAGIDVFISILDTPSKVQAVKAIQSILQKHIDELKLKEQANKPAESVNTENSPYGED